MPLCNELLAIASMKTRKTGIYIYQSQLKLLISTHESFLGLAKNPHTESEVVQFFSIFLWFYQYRKKGKEKADR